MINNANIKSGISVPYIPAKSPDESPVYINSIRIYENGGGPMYRYTYRPDVRTTTEMLDSSIVIYGDNDCFGEREILTDGSFGDYKWINYKTFQKMCMNFAAGLQILGIQKGDTIGIYSTNCTFWQVAQFGSHYLGCVPVPVYDSLGPGAAKYIVNHSECKVIVSHKNNLSKALEILSDSQLKYVISFSDDISNENDQVLTMQKLFEMGEENKEFRPIKLLPSDIGMIMYTSGSTGVPKGCVLTHQGILAGGNGLGGMGTSVTQTDTYFSFLPLAHIYELCSQTTLICQGARTGFYSGDMRNIVPDIQALRPTIMCAVPRVFNRLYDNMQKKINELPFLQRRVIQWAIHQKNESLVSGKSPSFIIDRLLLNKFSGALGGRLRLIVNGGAPILPEVYEFCRAAITPNIIQGYGLTEISAAGCVQQCGDKNPNTVGPVAITIDLKLRKIPGMNYDPQGNPPTGEIMFRGPSLFVEYYKNPELTKEAIVDGWFATGDVGKILPDGTIQIIDRVKQLVKLSQGEYISLTSLTDIYGTSKGVANIFVYANSHHNNPVAVVIPNTEQTEKWTQKGIVDPRNDKHAINEMMDNLNQVHKSTNMRGFEKLTGIMIDLEPFSIENGLLTPSQKPMIPKLRAKYEEKLIELLKSCQSQSQ